MELQEVQQISNLGFFLQDRRGFLRPPESGRDHLSRAYDCFASVESFLWIHFGVQVRYFPRAAARRATYEYFHVFLAAYEYIVESKLDQKFSPPLQRILASEFGGRSELFSQDEGLTDVPNRWSICFQGGLILSNEFASDPAAETLVDSMAFMKPAEWDATIHEPVGVRGSDFSSVTDRVIIPVLVIVQYMEAFRQLVRTSDDAGVDSQPSDISVAILAKERLKDLQRWRLDFREIPTFDRFMEVLDVALSLLAKTDEAAKDREGFVRAVRGLMMDWGAPPLSLHARA